MHGRRTIQWRDAQRRHREREANGLDLYWLSLPTTGLIDLLEAQDPPLLILPRHRIHYEHAEVERALSAYLLGKLTKGPR
jgi:hypothetical protein